MIDFFEKIVQGFFYAQYPFLHPQYWPYMLATALALVVLAAWLAIKGLRRLFARRAPAAAAPAAPPPQGS